MNSSPSADDAGFLAECDEFTSFIEVRDSNYLYYIIDNGTNVVIWAGVEVTLDAAKSSAVQVVDRLLSRDCTTSLDWIYADMPNAVRTFRHHLHPRSHDL
jgi:hypothetical protein